MFDGLFDLSTLRSIVDNTNRRISNLANIPDISENEVRAFCGLLLLFGVTHKRKVDLSEIYNPNSVHSSDWATATMPRDRFIIISRYITFDNIDTRDIRRESNPKFFKMSEIFDAIRNKFRTSFEPYSALCIDEELYLFRGKCAFRQYMPNKPNKYGIKFFEIVDVKTAYLLDSISYLGKSTTQRTLNVAEKVVLDLAKRISKAGEI